MKLITKIILFAIVFTMFGFITACAASNPPQTSTQPAVKPTPKDTPVVFKVNSLTINPPETNPGVQVIVTARVTNTSSTGTSYTPMIRVDNVAGGSLPSFLYLQKLVIPAGVTQLLSFVIPSDYTGKYRVTWGDVSGDYAVVDATPTVADKSTRAKTSAPDFTGVDVVTNEKIKLSQFTGSAVLLNFVNYGCDPSVNNVVSKQLLTIKELIRQRNDFMPVSVFCGCCPPDVLRDFAKNNGLTWPWILDTDNSIARKYLSYLRKFGYPTLVFIDPDQTIRGSAGYSDLATLSTKIDGIVGKSE